MMKTQHIVKDHFDVGSFFDENCLSICGIITSKVSNKFYEKWKVLHNDSSVDFLKVIINTPGGFLPDSLFISNLLKFSLKPVITFATVEASSCGILLLASGTKGFRFCTEYVHSILHEPFNSKTTDISEKGVDHYFDFLEKNSKEKKKTYLKMIRETDIKEVTLSADDLLKFGIVDHVDYPFNITASKPLSRTNSIK